MRSTNAGRSPSPQGGFSLLEVLVAMAVLAVGILGMAQLFLIAIEQNRRAAQHTEASNMLQHRLEQVRMLDYCDLEALATGIWETDTPIGDENMGQESLRVFQTRGDQLVGQTSRDWILERRIIGGPDLDTIDLQAVEDIILIELRGYRRGVRSEMTAAKAITVSAYRTKRSTEACP